MEKAPDAFRTISEVADEIDVPQHVLRFWESRFPQIRPMKRGGGRRYYRPDDVDLLRGVRHLLYGEGYTIRGVQRILREQGVTFVQIGLEHERRGAAARQRRGRGDRAGRRRTSETPVAARAEPNLFAVAAPRAPEPAPHSEGRREPTIVPPLSPEQPSPPVQPAQLSAVQAAAAPAGILRRAPSPRRIAGNFRRRLMS